MNMVRLKVQLMMSSKMKKLFLTTICIFLLTCIFNPRYVFAQTPSQLLKEGYKFYQQGNYSVAIKLYEKAIELNPNIAFSYLLLGMAHKDMGTDLSEVAWLFKTAVDIDPKYAEAWNNLGKAYYGMGEFDKAEKAALKALALKPDLIDAKLSLGWIYLLGKSQPADAIPYFNQVLGNIPIPRAYYGLGLAYFMNGNRAMVLEVITTLRSLDHDTMATQLENIVRSSNYNPVDTGRTGKLCLFGRIGECVDPCDVYEGYKIRISWQVRKGLE